MKKTYLLILLLSFISKALFAQSTNCNVTDGYAIDGYDVVAYFDNKAIQGNSKYIFNYNNIKYKFSTLKNLEKFKVNPKNYLPQYGGWCAYAMGTKGKKVDMDPKVFEIRDHKLYLFYTSYFTNTYKKWLKANPEKLRKNADKEWDKIISKPE